jgi:hypothetical protein
MPGTLLAAGTGCAPLVAYCGGADAKSPAGGADGGGGGAS